MPRGRTRGGGGRRVAIHLRMSATTVVVPFGEGKRYRQNNPFVRTLWSMTAGVLLMMLFSGASRSYFGRGGGGNNTACADHVLIEAKVSRLLMR